MDFLDVLDPYTVIYLSLLGVAFLACTITWLATSENIRGAIISGIVFFLLIPLPVVVLKQYTTWKAQTDSPERKENQEKSQEGAEKNPDF